MLLTIIGPVVPTETGENARSEDYKGNIVIISATTEAIQDFDWPRITEVASDKYNNDDIVSGSQPPLITVSSKECSCDQGDK